MATGAQGREPFEAVVLAAGSGVRFGGGKLLASYAGGLVLEGALRAAFAAPVRGVTLVIGADAPRVAAAARGWAQAAGEIQRLRIVHAANHEDGMGASLSAGVAALPPGAAGVFVFLGDMPRVPEGVLDALAVAARGAPAAAPVFDGRRGHPVVIGRSLFPQVLALSGDQGARAVLQPLGERLALVPAPDDGVLFDVDERKDLLR